MTRSARSVALAGAAAALVAAGCGGSSGPSKQQFAAKADAMCRQVRVAQVQQLGPNPNTPAGIAAFDAGVLRIVRPREQQFRNLKPPKGEEATWKAYLRSRKQNDTLIQREEQAASSGNQQELQAVDKGRPAEVAARAKLAAKLGLKVCGNQKDLPNLLGPEQPVGPPPSSVHYVKPKDTLDDAIKQLQAVRTCSDLRALQNSDDTKIPTAACGQLLPALAGFSVVGKDDLGPIGVVDIVSSKAGHGTVVFAEDAKDGRLKFANVVGVESGSIHKPAGTPDAQQNIAAVLAALRAGDAAAIHRAVSPNSSFYTMPPAKAAQLPSPTGSGARLLKDLKADRAAKPQTLGIDLNFAFWAIKANGHNWLLFDVKGPTGYRWNGFYPQPAG